jgi:hypothetical protein
VHRTLLIANLGAPGIASGSVRALPYSIQVLRPGIRANSIKDKVRFLAKRPLAMRSLVHQIVGLGTKRR